MASGTLVERRGRLAPQRLREEWLGVVGGRFGAHIRRPLCTLMRCGVVVVAKLHVNAADGIVDAVLADRIVGAARAVRGLAHDALLSWLGEKSFHFENATCQPAFLPRGRARELKTT